MCVSRSVMSIFVSPWTVAHQVPLFMEFSRQEYWNGLPFPSPGTLPDPGIEPASPALASRLFVTEPDKMWLLCYLGLFAATVCWPSLALLLSKTVWYP